MNLKMHVNRKGLIIFALWFLWMAGGAVSVFAQSGVVVFTSQRDGNENIYVVDEDGANEQQITLDAGKDQRPAISPDGQQIAFVSDRTGPWELYLIGIDGTGLTQLTTNLPTTSNVRGIDWHPDGSKLILSLYQNNIHKLFEIGADGTGLTQLVSETVNGTTLDVGIADYNHDGSRIVMGRNAPFNSASSRIWVSNADGSGMTQLTTIRSGAPDWVFDDGVEKIAFQARISSSNWQLYLMEADGSNQSNISNNGFQEEVVSGPDGPGETDRAGTLVFASRRNGVEEIWMRNIDGTNEMQITTAGGWWPDWWAGPVNAPPVADAGPDQTAECATPTGATVTLDASASSDPDGDLLTFAWTLDGTEIATGETPTVTLPLGTHTITLTVTDPSGETDSDEVLVIVEDTTAPTLTLGTSAFTLWPPNHAYHPFTPADALASVTDACDGSVAVAAATITAATSDEPDDDTGDGNTTDDLVLSADCTTLDLRAERQGSGNGRVYTVDLALTDASGNTGTALFTVAVPKSKKKAAIDDGAVHSVACTTSAPSTRIVAAPQPTVAEEGIASPQGFQLVSAYPNPFNPVTTLRFALAEASEVRLVVYDALGRAVARLVEGTRSAGTHTVRFDASGLPSGMYLARMEAGGTSFTHPLLLMK